jgi:hypothetical protein
VPFGGGEAVRIRSFSLSISAPFWKGRSGELEAKKNLKVYQIEAGDPEGHPWLTITHPSRMRSATAASTTIWANFQTGAATRVGRPVTTECSTRCPRGLTRGLLVARPQGSWWLTGLTCDPD